MVSTSALVPPTGTGRRSTDSLLPVLRVIPARCYERSTAKGLAYVARAVVIYLAALTLLALTNTWWLLLPLWVLSLIHISEPTRLGMISYAVFCLKKKK